MGSKGSQTTNTAQSQTYAPAGAGYIQNALNQGQAAAQLPFNIPQAPVAGFSPQQQQAFGLVGQAQGQAQPYINQANQYFQQSAQAPNVSQFFNPLAGAVTSQLNNIFGQQNSQNTGQLTQAAGGVGADRIAVGQSELANQQGLAAGQTLAGLYTPALGAAQQEQNILQGAGYGTAALGSQAQNATLSGAQALLGTGGLQQQLAQAQLNAPYQQQLAQAAFPYQQAQFNAGITGALAPGLGGTTQGTGTSQSQYNPSAFSQILGGAGALGSIGGYLLANRGGSYSRGGSANPFAFATGGSPYSLPSGLSDQPINVDAMNIIPQENLSTAHPNTPTLNLNAPQPNMQPSSGNTGKGSNSGLGGLTANQLGGSGGQNFLGMSDSAQDALQDFMEGDNRGGAVNQPFQTFDSGGTPYGLAESTDPDTTPALFGDRFPGYLSAGPENAPVNALAGTGMVPQDAQKYPVGRADAPFNPYRMADASAVQAWRDDTPATPDANADTTSPSRSMPTAGAGTPAPSGPGASAPPPSATTTPDAAPTPESGKSLAGFLKSPYAALLQASLSAFTPQGFAGGLQQGMKEFQGQESIDQSAKKLAQEAQFHQDQFTKMTPYEQAEIGNKKAELDYKKQLLGEGTMSPQAVDLAVDRIKAGDPRALTNLGRGAQSGINLTRIQNRLAERAQEEGWNGATLAQAQATFSSQAAAARNQAIRSSNIEQAVEEAKNTFPLALQASESVPRGTWVPLNQLKQAAEASHSDPALARFNTANQAVITAYSQAMSRTGVSTVHAQEAAERLLSTATSPEAYKAVISQLELEMEAAKSAPDTVRQRILNRIGQGATGAGQPASASGAAATPAAPAAAPAGGAATTPQKGERKQFKQGWGVWDGSKWVPAP
jgi:hypothetical protein